MALEFNMHGTIFSPCRQYRYTLWRDFGANPEAFAMFIGLNPSTADEVQDDPTIRRCIGYAKAWGYGGLVMTNLFAFRATDPDVMKAQLAPIGSENDKYIAEYAARARIVVAAWGTHGTHIGRDAAVRKLIGDRLHYLRLTKEGHPGHPLYLPKSLTPQPWGNA